MREPDSSIGAELVGTFGEPRVNMLELNLDREGERTGQDLLGDPALDHCVNGFRLKNPVGSVPDAASPRESYGLYGAPPPVVPIG